MDEGPLSAARAEVLRSGTTVTTCHAEVYGSGGDGETLVAAVLSTILTRPRKEN